MPLKTVRATEAPGIITSSAALEAKLAKQIQAAYAPESTTPPCIILGDRFPERRQSAGAGRHRGVQRKWGL